MTCQNLKCVPPLPCNLEKLNLANCFALESISDLSELTMLRELNLTNCVKVNDITGLEHLTDETPSAPLKYKKRLSKVISTRPCQVFEEGGASSKGESIVT
ncbi:unnamed protein product [Eruca vesicaria subsp. sativa]|uniref:CC-NBS-LRR protein n=1 Tax=Eruca vesicaria subsp. sativa TaxID=29727 RepID=A0ABC8KVN5_ERUVS|nr:unnamed protein product [Eruca vesicaria subsp. sativa]